jgi:hypothetical protein
VTRPRGPQLPGDGPTRVVDRARLERRRRNHVLLVAALAASMAISALLTLEMARVAPLSLRGRLPQEGEIAEVSVKAPTDLRIVDKAASEELRRTTLDQSPAIYDFDERRAAQLTERVHAAFSAARAALARGGEPAAAPAPADAFRDALKDVAGAPLGELAVVEKSGFGQADEQGVLAALGAVAPRMIVDDMDGFLQQIDKRPVIVRDVGSGRERRLAGRESVIDRSAALDALRAQVERVFPDQGRKEQRELLAVIEPLIQPNVRQNLRATDERRQAAEASLKDVVIALRKGEIIVRDGEPFTARHLLLLEGMREQSVARGQLGSFVGLSATVLVLLIVLWRFGSGSLQRFPREPRDALFLLSGLVATVVGTRVGLYLCDAIAERPEITALIGDDPEPLYFALPIAAATMLVRLVLSAETAAVYALVVSILAGLQLHGQVSFTLYSLVGSLVAAIGVARVTQRGTLLRAGLRVGLANALVVAAALGMVLGLLSGPLAAILVSGVAPLVETIFSYTTDVKLLEMANREQSLLRQLELSAPGTYHHSMMVGHLAEKAAEAIGANALLAKVGGYYHDIGKMRRPQFFIENVTIHGGENRHEKLSPSMSARIIQAHVKDGLELGRQNKLAPPIMSGIGEHHGTSIIRFFYEKAKEQADPDKGDEVQEHEYRYGGPKPQTREAGILMLADSVEAASRTLGDTSPARIQQLVQRVINNYFRDGQLDECSLTLRDLNAIARSLIDTLSAIRHERIDYPEPSDDYDRRIEDVSDEGVAERLEPRAKDRSEAGRGKREDDLRRLGLS